MNKRGFNQALRRIEQSEDLREEMGEKGASYVKSNYDWTLIMGRLKQAIKSI
jgi:glycosyltransferase